MLKRKQKKTFHKLFSILGNINVIPPHFAAATNNEPDPTNGSKTKSPFLIRA